MKSIIFDTQSVKAILDNRKTQTRRVIKFPKGAYPHWYHGQNEDETHDFAFGEISNGCCLDWTDTIKAPFKPGDVLYIKETWRYEDFMYIDDWSAHIRYRADNVLGNRIICRDGADSRTGWQSSAHMSLEAARLFLRVTDVGAERIQDITNEDMLKEGYPRGWGQYNFGDLWDSINTKRGYGWDTNPWVWVYTFERIEKEDV